MSAQKKTLESIGIDDAIALEQLKPLLNLRKRSLDEVKQLVPNHPEIYDLLRNSKIGYISIQKVSDNAGYLSKGMSEEGWTAAFGEGLSLRMELGFSYYYTSTIQSINWEKGYFDTLNSRYEFKFNEINFDEIMEYLENASKGQETE